MVPVHSQWAGRASSCPGGDPARRSWDGLAGTAGLLLQLPGKREDRDSRHGDRAAGAAPSPAGGAALCWSTCSTVVSVYLASAGPRRPRGAQVISRATQLARAGRELIPASRRLANPDFNVHTTCPRWEGGDCCRLFRGSLESAHLGSNLCSTT